jgi:hypothetical protein
VMAREAYDVRADVYSHAMTLYELNTQQTPFSAIKQVGNDSKQLFSDQGLFRLHDIVVGFAATSARRCATGARPNAVQRTVGDVDQRRLDAECRQTSDNGCCCDKLVESMFVVVVVVVVVVVLLLFCVEIRFRVSLVIYRFTSWRRNAMLDRNSCRVV